MTHSFWTIVEFENDFAACFQEMIKLTQLRGKLKVLVTYDYPYKDNPGTKNDWVEIARRNWRSIIRDAHSHLPEPGVEYLLAIGQLSNTESKGSNPDMTWYFTSLSTSLSEGFKDTEVKISSNQ